MAGIPEREPGTTRRWWLAPVAIVVVATAIRVVAIGADAGYEPANDSFDYHRHAVSIAAGEGYPDSEYGSGAGPTALRPPGYPIFLGAVYAVSGDSVSAGRLAGAALGALSVWLLYSIVAPLWGRRTALLAAGMLAIFPPAVLMTTELWSENLFVAVTLGAVLAGIRYGATGRMRWAVAAGVLCGVALLTRNIGLALLVPLLIAAAVNGRRLGRPFAAPATMAACVALAVIPWTIRNLAEFDRFVPVAASSGVTSSGVYNPTSMDDPTYPAGWRNPSIVPAFRGIFETPAIDEASLDAELRSRAVEFALDHPGYVVEASWHNLLRMFTVEGGSVVAFEGEAPDLGIGNRSVPAEQIALAIVTLLALVGGVVTLRDIRGDRGGRREDPAARVARLLLLALPLILVLATAPLNGLPRHRLTVDPFLLIFASVGALLLWDKASARFRRRGKAGGRSGRLTSAAAMAMASMLLLGGCGGDEPRGDDPGAAGGPAKTAEPLDPAIARKADAICRRTAVEVAELQKALAAGEVSTPLTGPQAIAEVLIEPGLEIRARQAAALRRIAPPPGESLLFESYLATFDVTDELLRQRLAIGRQGGVVEGQEQEALIVEVGEEQMETAAELGLEQCAVDFTDILAPPSEG
jgi:hypothetical protein